MNLSLPVPFAFLSENELPVGREAIRRVSVPEMSLDYVLATYRALSLRLLDPERQMLNTFSKQKSRLRSSFSPSLVGKEPALGSRLS